MTPGHAWDAYVTAQQTADEAVGDCGGTPEPGTPLGGPRREPARRRGPRVVTVRGRGAGGARRWARERGHAHLLPDRDALADPAAGPDVQGLRACLGAR